MGRWKPTPKTDLINVKRYDRQRGDWNDVQFRELKCGDIYATFAQDGTRVRPDTLEPTDDAALVALTSMDARKCMTRGVGYEVMVTVESLEYQLKAAAN